MTVKEIPALGAENLCRQAVFMNRASCAVTSLYPEMVQVGDAVRQRTERRGLAESAVGWLLSGRKTEHLVHPCETCR
jgi:hypothetical protein